MFYGFMSMVIIFIWLIGLNDYTYKKSLVMTAEHHNKIVFILGKPYAIMSEKEYINMLIKTNKGDKNNG